MNKKIRPLLPKNARFAEVGLRNLVKMAYSLPEEAKSFLW